MAKKKVVEKIEQVVEKIEVEEPVIKKERKKLSPESLEKLQKARILALEKRRELKPIKDAVKEAKKELEIDMNNPINELEAYTRVKKKVDEELKTNEIVGINERMNKMLEQFNHIDSKLNTYIDDKNMRREMKQKQQIMSGLPTAVSRQMLEEELKRVEMDKFRRNIFGW